jgi:hypothetical protein
MQRPAAWRRGASSSRYGIERGAERASRGTGHLIDCVGCAVQAQVREKEAALRTKRREWRESEIQALEDMERCDFIVSPGPLLHGLILSWRICGAIHHLAGCRELEEEAMYLDETAAAPTPIPMAPAPAPAVVTAPALAPAVDEQWQMEAVLAKLNQLDKLDKILHKLGTITISYVMKQGGETRFDQGRRDTCHCATNAQCRGRGPGWRRCAHVRAGAERDGGPNGDDHGGRRPGQGQGGGQHPVRETRPRARAHAPVPGPRHGAEAQAPRMSEGGKKPDPDG